MYHHNHYHHNHLFSSYLWCRRTPLVRSAHIRHMKTMDSTLAFIKCFQMLFFCKFDSEHCSYRFTYVYVGLLVWMSIYFSCLLLLYFLTPLLQDNGGVKRDIEIDKPFPINIFLFVDHLSHFFHFWGDTFHCSSNDLQNHPRIFPVVHRRNYCL